MKILLVHNYYQQAGGEDQVFSAESELLESYGHKVYYYTVHNNVIPKLNRLRLSLATTWNSETYHKLRSFIKQVRPEIAHFHNTFPLVSPSAYYAAKSEGVPVVQTLHNYRLLCPSANFFRNGQVCEECLGKFIPGPGVVHACYRERRTASAVIAMLLTTHRLAQTWIKKVDVYVAPSEFTRQKFIEGGFPRERIIAKPNFVNPDPGIGQGYGKYAIFVGRLSREKGIDTLLEAWKHLDGKLKLVIVGNGPLASIVATAVKSFKDIVWVGQKTKKEVHDLIGGAYFLIFPSLCYETFGLVVAEAFAKGTPVISSDEGAAKSVINHSRSGLFFKVNDSKDLVRKVMWAIDNPKELRRMRHCARAEFDARLTGEKNYEMLMDIYKTAKGMNTPTTSI